MVIHLEKIALFAFILYFEGFKGFWACFFLGLFFDLLSLSTPLGFYAGIFGLMQLGYQQVRYYAPSLGSRYFFAWTYGFFFFASLIPIMLVGYHARIVEDLVFGPLFDCAIFSMLNLIVHKVYQAKRGPYDEEAD